MGCVDTKLEMGQTRVVSEDVVQQRVEELLSNPRIGAVEIYCPLGTRYFFLIVWDAYWMGQKQ